MVSRFVTYLSKSLTLLEDFGVVDLGRAVRVEFVGAEVLIQGVEFGVAAQHDWVYWREHRDNGRLEVGLSELGREVDVVDVRCPGRTDRSYSACVINGQEGSFRYKSRSRFSSNVSESFCIANYLQERKKEHAVQPIPSISRDRSASSMQKTPFRLSSTWTHPWLPTILPIQPMHL